SNAPRDQVSSVGSVHTIPMAWHSSANDYQPTAVDKDAKINALSINPFTKCLFIMDFLEE
ncbi:MAG: hypothetical protein ACKN9S_00250, partial [Pirellula sp.]